MVGIAAAADLVVYSTPYFPSNRLPGTTPFSWSGLPLLMLATAIGGMNREYRMTVAADA